VSRRERQKRRRRNRGRPVRHVIIATIVVVLLGCVAAGIAAGGWVVSVLDDTPNIDQLRPKPQGGISTVYAADGTRLGFISGDTLRTEIPSGAIPRVLKRATVSIEDRRFYQHGGVDYVGIARAALKNVSSDSAAQGGSTLTMQLVRNLYIPQDRLKKTLTRKIREVKLADELEKQHSKEWVLTSYLNNVPYGTVGGKTAVGVAAASRMFFDKTPAQLTLPESALLAGLPQAPTDYNPFLHPSRAKRRRNEVLQSMVKAQYLTQAQADKAARAPLGVKRNNYYAQRREQFFFDYVREELNHRYGKKRVNEGGLKVYTTINLNYQTLARRAISDHLNQPGQPSAALVTIDPANGHILAMASSATYGQSNGGTNFNYATQGRRQPGSTFKAIDLMAAVRMGVDPDSTNYNSHELMPGWDPVAPTWHVQTDDHSYSGSISLTEAMAKSDNTVYAQLGADVTPQRITQTAYDMGVTSKLDSYPAEAIGGLTYGVSPLEMANAYATIADGGVRNTATAIERVVKPDGTVDVGTSTRRREFTDGQTAKVIKALKGVITNGTGTGLSIGCPAAGKTGTTSNNTDGWFDGFTPRLSTAVWTGYPKSTQSMGYVPGYGTVFGATIAGPIWQQFMESIKGSYCDDFPAPRQAFTSAPWDGRYQSQGQAAGGSSSNGNGTANGNGTGNGTSTGATGGTTTPGAFAHAPQQPPQTQTPPTAGGGGGGGGGGQTGNGQSGGGQSGGGAAPTP
jgi:penicillin-binding protein 1A